MQITKFGKRQAAVTALVGTAMAGAVALAPAASAASGGGCRVSVTGSWAVEPGGVDLDSCAYFNPSDSRNVEARIGYVDVSPIDPCAQLVNVATGAVAFDYGCIGWVNKFTETYSNYLVPRADFAAGRYVVRVGYWMDDANGNLKFWGDVESPVITLT